MEMQTCEGKRKLERGNAKTRREMQKSPEKGVQCGGYTLTSGTGHHDFRLTVFGNHSHLVF